MGTAKKDAAKTTKPIKKTTGITKTVKKTVKKPAVEKIETVVPRKNIDALRAQIDPNEKLEPEVESILIDVAEDFVRAIAENASKIAAHRGSAELTAQDVSYYVDKFWHFRVPGHDAPRAPRPGETPATEDYAKRQAEVKKALAAASAGAAATTSTPAAASTTKTAKKAAKEGASTITSPTAAKKDAVSGLQSPKK
mmetsp:Transcript_39433/g.101085  ORF Transcript_39433/g.101085 Transcript_39433/m.101085 type:complete len:196 (-) Transcript_39433:420-1007(-)|eukprot:CAMPEP_0113879848 /NCGR_PEP_ID=MMETSP0780_2-20120614/7458_1 /TAXON_ID=652834 /ORGANISM="Palpitomonas bilix" /LENGTH=195 /DNA_ID=CAMNT_0000866459 /DNA_START=341 /DNA_END=928 /DNA_ORIENTATION=+ /assembly_acc=CAM_ASM_000599